MKDDFDLFVFNLKFRIVCTQYLESVGGTWYQCWISQFIICCLLTLWYWILSNTFVYYNTNKSENYIYHPLNTTQSKDTNTATTIDHEIGTKVNFSYNSIGSNNSQHSISHAHSSFCTYAMHAQSKSDMQIQSNVNYSSENYGFLVYLWSVFPPVNKEYSKHWMILIIRSFSGVFCFTGLDIALMYLDSGDTILIQIVLVTLLNLLFGVIFFNEKLNKIIIKF